MERGLEAVVLECEASRLDGCADDVGLGVEPALVHHRRDQVAGVVDELQRLGLGRGGVGYRPALRIHPAATGEAAVLVEPVEDAELVVAESTRERVADRPAGIEGVHELCDGGLLQARSAETASPDSSAFGTNPRADDSATS